MKYALLIYSQTTAEEYADILAATRQAAAASSHRDRAVGGLHQGGARGGRARRGRAAHARRDGHQPCGSRTAAG